MCGVGWLASQQRRLDVEGTLDPRNAVGQTATVYLRVPAHGQGQGKVHVKVQGRTAELAATSDGPEIPTGAVPEPSTYGLMGAGALCALVIYRRRKRKA